MIGSPRVVSDLANGDGGVGMVSIIFVQFVKEGGEPEPKSVVAEGDGEVDIEHHCCSSPQFPRKEGKRVVDDIGQGADATAATVLATFSAPGLFVLLQLVNWKQHL